ncbi:MAG: YDG/SRA domain-containing protein [Chloroflexota bacterium]
MINPGEIISYLEMCSDVGVNLQRGMNYHIKNNISVILMSLRPNAPYADKIEDEGRILIYEGHDVSKTKDSPIPKIIDQPLKNPGGSLTQNGLFYTAVSKYKTNQKNPELVRVFEKLHRGIWVYNGLFVLIDAWQEKINNRNVLKFKLELIDSVNYTANSEQNEKVILEHNRLIPPKIKLEVWQRDKGRCVKCGSANNLHFDHIIPFSRGGSSLVAENIQLLCARHNIAKRDKIE